MHKIKKESPYQFELRVRFYPEDTSGELIQAITLLLFYLQVKDSIGSGEIFCPSETRDKLDSLADAINTDGLMSNYWLLPHSATGSPYKLSLGGQQRETMREYLKIAQQLEMYGVTYFEVRDRKRNEMFLGVTPMGLNLYDKENKLTPTRQYSWDVISTTQICLNLLNRCLQLLNFCRNLSYNDIIFVIKQRDRKASQTVFYSRGIRFNKEILFLAMSYGYLYLNRRNGQSLWAQQRKVIVEAEAHIIVAGHSSVYYNALIQHPAT